MCVVMMCEPRTVLSAGFCSASSDCARSEGAEVQAVLKSL